MVASRLCPWSRSTAIPPLIDVVIDRYARGEVYRPSPCGMRNAECGIKVYPALGLRAEYLPFDVQTGALVPRGEEAAEDRAGPGQGGAVQLADAGDAVRRAREHRFVGSQAHVQRQRL